jgi:hypothetical protein
MIYVDTYGKHSWPVLKHLKNSHQKWLRKTIRMPVLNEAQMLYHCPSILSCVDVSLHFVALHTLAVP